MSKLKVGSVMVSEADQERAQEILQTYPAQIVYLMAGALQIDESYQRRPESAKVAKMAQRWNELAVGIIFVSRRADGGLFITDGGHRVYAAIQRFGPGRELECKMYDALTLPLEAGMFYWMNAHRGLPSILKRYRAALTSGEPEVVEIAEVVKAVGLKPSFTGAGADERTVLCWGALHELYRRGGRRHLEEVLELVEATWGDQRIALEGQFVKGVSLLVRHHGKEEAWSLKEAVERLKRISALEIDRDAQDRRRTREARAMPPQYAIYHSLLWFYNRNRRTSKLGDPKKPK